MEHETSCDFCSRHSRPFPFYPDTISWTFGTSIALEINHVEQEHIIWIPLLCAWHLLYTHIVCCTSWHLLYTHIVCCTSWRLLYTNIVYLWYHCTNSDILSFLLLTNGLIVSFFGEKRLLKALNVDGFLPAGEQQSARYGPALSVPEPRCSCLCVLHLLPLPGGPTSMTLGFKWPTFVF